VQPSEYFTRQLILHEATHQFHYLAATGNQDPSARWYIEGLAEYFGMHNWDGAHLKTGVIPTVTLEDYPAKALKNLDDLNQNLEGMISGTIASDRPEAWALVRFLREIEPKKSRALFDSLDLKVSPLPAWQKVFGKVTAKLVQRFRAWLVAHPQPWKVVWVSWQERGEFLEGKAQVNAIALLKLGPSKLEVTIESREESAKAGVVFGYRSNEDFYLCQFVGSGQLRVTRRREGRWEVLHSSDSSTGSTISLSQTDSQVLLSVNGVEIAWYDIIGEVGLNVEGGRALFRVNPTP
jgi:hypothetical protein